MKKFDYSDVERLLKVVNPEMYFGFVFRGDGIWLIPPGSDGYRGTDSDYDYEVNKEGEIVLKLSTWSDPLKPYDYSKPVLPLPCTQEELRDFLVRSGLHGMLAPGHEVLVKNLIANEEAQENTNVSDDETSIQESDEELCNRLKRAGLTDKKIALELKRKFPKIYPSRIGRLITGIEGIRVTPEAYRKRGKRLLEIK